MGDQCEEQVTTKEIIEKANPVEEKTQTVESETEIVTECVTADNITSSKTEIADIVTECEVTDNTTDVTECEVTDNSETVQTEATAEFGKTDQPLLLKPKGPGGRPRKKRRRGIIRSGFTHVKKRKALTDFQSFPKYTVVYKTTTFAENNGSNQTSLQERQLIESVVEVNKLKAMVNRKLLAKQNPPRKRSPPPQPLYTYTPIVHYPYRTNSCVEQMRIKQRMDLQRRRRMLEKEIAVDAQNKGTQNGSGEIVDKKSNVESCDNSYTVAPVESSHEEESSDTDSEQDLNNMMEPEIVIETQDECFVEYNVESSTTPEPNRVLHFLSANTEYDPSLRNEQAAVPHQTGKLESSKLLQERLPPLAALVKVPVGAILCNFGHVIEQARKLERHSLRCGLGGEMVYQMTLKTGSIYEAIYRCSQPNCAVRMTISSDFCEKPLII